MDKHRSHMEEQFRKAFEHFEIPVNDMDFAAIERKLSLEKKRRRYWLWLLLLLIPVSGFLAWWTNTSFGTKQQKISKQETFRKPQRTLETAAISESELHSEIKPESHFNHHHAILSQLKSRLTDYKVGPVERIHSSESNRPSTFEKRSMNDLIQLRTKTFVNWLHRDHTLPQRLDAIVPLFTFPSAPKTEPVPLNQNPLWQTSLRLGTGKNTPQWESGMTDPQLLKYRKLNEQPSGYSDVVLLASRHQKGWQYQSGIGFQQFSTESTQLKWQLFDSIPVLNPQGDTLGFFKFNYRDTLVSGNWTNQYNYLTIPLNISKSIALNGKNQLIFGAGLQIQFLAGTSGEYLKNANEFLPLQKEFLTKTMSQWDLSLGYQRQLSSELSAQIAFQYRKSFNGITFREQDLTMKMQQSGLFLQLNYRIR